MNTLRQRMWEDMRIRNLSLTTQKKYLRQVASFANYFNKSPRLLGIEDIRVFLLYLAQERKLSASSINVTVSALRFLYKVTLGCQWDIEKIEYFWGYRNHVVLDAISELPVGEITKPANVSEQILFVPLFTQIQNSFNFPIKEVLADAMYDVEYILKFVIRDLKALPRIARNPRWQTHSDVKPSPTGGLICIAGFNMIYWGKFKDRGKIRLKFVCPVTHSKKFAKSHPVCPWLHPKFLKGKGCIAYLRGDSNVRTSINYGSESFKKSYNRRTSSERVFSRVLTLSMQNPSVIGLQATANHCTIAHITVLLIALTAVKTGHKDKIRFIKKFLPFI